VKNLKLAILGFAALGLALWLSEFELFKAMLTHPFAGSGTGLILIGGFVLPLVMGIMGMTKPPFQMWQAVASLAGFAAIAIKTEIWSALPHIADAGGRGILMIVAIIGGIVVSAMAIAKPEAKA
jgi:hypothetical protein